MDTLLLAVVTLRRSPWNSWRRETGGAREHSDLDLWLTAEGFEPFVTAAAELGVDRLTPWPGDRPWNVVVTDGASLRLDLHLVEALPNGDLHYGSALGGHRFPAAALSGTGTIAGRVVRCEAAEWSLRFH